MMIYKWTRTVLLLLLAFSLFAQGATAAEKKDAQQRGKYKQVTGEVVSVGQDSIMLKSKSKGTMTLAITKNTDMIGQPVKAGDKATVNYRADENGNTATRISARTARDNAPKRKTAASSAKTQ